MQLRHSCLIATSHQTTSHRLPSCHLRTHSQPHYIMSPDIIITTLHPTTHTPPNHKQMPKHHHQTERLKMAEGYQPKRFGHGTGWSPVVHSTNKFLLWLKVFHPETFAPASPGKCLCICMYMYTIFKLSISRLLFTRIGQIYSEYLQQL